MGGLDPDTDGNVSWVEEEMLGVVNTEEVGLTVVARLVVDSVRAKQEQALEYLCSDRHLPVTYSGILPLPLRNAMQSAAASWFWLNKVPGRTAAAQGPWQGWQVLVAWA
jgi:hypothetical protein